jgi:amino acid adenylation domain-containing protein
VRPMSDVPTVLGGFAAQVRHRPRAAALVYRGAEVSYGELHRRVLDAGGRLARLGLDPGAVVAVVAAKSPDAIALILALRAKGHPVLLPPLDLPAATRTALFATAGCRAVLAPGAESPDLVTEPIDPAGHEPVDQPAEPAAFLLTTSGSTGLPKIVPLPAAAVDAFAAWAAARFQIRPHRTVLNYAPLNFDLCLLDIWTTLAAGGRVVLVEAEQATRPARLHELLSRNRVGVVQAVPMLYELLLEHGGTLPDATHVISTGDALRARCLSRLPGLFPNARLYNLYGCTETNDSFLHEIDPAAPLPVPIGRPIQGVSAVLVEPTGTALTGPGVGELYVSTPFQTPGYLDATLTAAAFGPHPDGADGRTYFHSGDLVRRHPDGTLTLEGRADFQVKVRGVRVNTQEVERALLEHTAVAEAVVFALPDPVTGSALHAVVRRDDPRSLHSLAVRAHCAQRLPRPAIPTAIHLVDEPLPTTSTGKPDRTRIKRTYLERQR